MADDLALLLGTKKGAFVLRAVAGWQPEGPYCDAAPVNHMIGCPQTGRLWAAVGGWFGPGVWRSDDLGATWEKSDTGLAYDAGDGAEVVAIWSLARRDGTLFAGAQPAGLFESQDGGATWAHIRGLRDHPTRPDWPPGGAGLTLHHIVADPVNTDRIWVGISSAGVFGTTDGGTTWAPMNTGTRNDYAEDPYPVFGQCVHGLVQVPGSDRLYQQNHCGMYRSDDGAASWVSIEAGLPSTFGFPVAVHPEDPDTVWLVPMNGDAAGRYPPEGRPGVWRSRDAGATWEVLRSGLPARGYFTVLRQAMCADAAGLSFGTTSGAVFRSTDDGETWTTLAEHLPAVLSVEAVALPG
ncbi:MAG: exo-alpha-sialidase [Pseudomonadota bacterium]